jgi:hypothetical protein
MLGSTMIQQGLNQGCGHMGTLTLCAEHIAPAAHPSSVALAGCCCARSSGVLVNCVPVAQRAVTAPKQGHAPTRHLFVLALRPFSCAGPSGGVACGTASCCAAGRYCVYNYQGGKGNVCCPDYATCD